MNTYHISGRAVYRCEYTVEAENETDAINEVEFGLDADDMEWECVDDIEIMDVEYGEVERSGKLGITFVTRGNVDEDNIRDALYSLLARCDGTTVAHGEGELELIGFSVDHIDEV